MTRYINLFKILEQLTLTDSQRKHSLNRRRLLYIIIKRGKDQKRFHAVGTPHIVVFDSHRTLWKIDVNEFYNHSQNI